MPGDGGRGRLGVRRTVARDIFIQLDRCQYCNRSGFVVWDVDL